MNASDWKKAAAFVSQQKQAATTAPTEQLSSMPLSANYLWMTVACQ